VKRHEEDREQRRERRSGYVIIFLGSILGAGVPVIHMLGRGVGGEIAKSSGGFFFVWTLSRLACSRLARESTRSVLVGSCSCR
jgi:biotin transporter BioY